MLPARHITLLAHAALGFGAGTAVAAAQEVREGATLSEADSLRLEVAKLRRQNEVLADTVIEAKRSEAEAAQQLAQIKQRLEALGKNLLDGGDDRLVQAAAEIQLLQERLEATEKAAMSLASQTQEFVRLAVVVDPDARLRLETSIRALDAALGLRHKPRPDLKTGSLQRAQVVSIDAESGLLVVNIGQNHQCRIGMTYSILRGERPYGKAIIADVRKNVAGAFVEQLDPPNEIVRLGDTILLETQPQR
jgi:multidrug efflux pump subunit AcrA (membrane-fusion protein)